jgi:uncharacterized membrane protein YphA (DoxX/SURF4 family)
MGVPMPMLSATLSACAEFFGGVALLLGFGVRIAVIPMVIVFLIAVLLITYIPAMTTTLPRWFAR